MNRRDKVCRMFDYLCNTNLSTEDDIPEISSDDKVKLVKIINDAKIEAERLHILEIMRKVCKPE